MLLVICMVICALLHQMFARGYGYFSPITLRDVGNTNFIISSIIL